jgi:hypothetical protein
MRSLLVVLLASGVAAFSLTLPARSPVVTSTWRHAAAIMQVRAVLPVEQENCTSLSGHAACGASQAEDEAEPTPEPEPAPAPAPAPEPEPEPSPEPFAAMEDDMMAMDEAAIAKEALKSEIADGLGGTTPDRAVVGEILLALEAQNPTRSPATSPLLNGRWKFLYASGASPGLKALQLLLRGAKVAPKSPSGAELVDVQDTYLTISANQPRATAEVKVRVLSFDNTIKLASRLEAESAVRIVETYEAAESEYGGVRLPFQSPVEYKRSLLLSYLDNELMVVRDATGRADVLVRADEPSAWAPSSLDGEETDDADAPGAS